jgi:hypothetical protein
MRRPWSTGERGWAVEPKKKNQLRTLIKTQNISIGNVAL